MEKTVTARDYTLMELKAQARDKARCAFWIGLLSGVILGVIGTWIYEMMTQ